MSKRSRGERDEETVERERQRSLSEKKSERDRRIEKE